MCKSAMQLMQITTLLLLGTANSAFICATPRALLRHDFFAYDHTIQRQLPSSFDTMLLSERCKLTALRGSLRDILNDGPLTTSESVNSQIDTVEQRQKLTNQLKNFSTQEIKRELEQTFKISTAALRGKDQLITALVMARLTGSLSVPPTDGGVDPNFRDQYNEPTRGDAPRNGSTWVNNANYQKDMELMSVGEIKRELQIYGVLIDEYADKMGLLSALKRERRLRNIPTPSKRPKIEVNVVPTASPRSNRNASPVMSDEGGNESIRSPSKMAELTKVTILTKNQKEAKKSQSQSQPNENYQRDTSYSFTPNDFSDEIDQQQGEYYSSYLPMDKPFYADEVTPFIDASQQDGSYDGEKLRELQIAFEFDRVQAARPTPDQIRQELASNFDIDTKYFMGVNEMVYALAVARVDAAIERDRRRRAGEDDGCEVSDGRGGAPISKNRNANFDGFTQNVRPECVDVVNGALPSREELIAMEFQRLQPLDEYELSWELEAQYGIPAKHFLGQQELAYALAVERVDTAQKEADAANEEESSGVTETQDPNQFAWMSDEDMMKMMEEEMMKESPPHEPLNAEQGKEVENNQGKSSAQSTKSSQSKSLKDMIQNNSKKASRSQQSANGNFQYQGESLRERERRENQTKQKHPPKQMGTVVGNSWDQGNNAKPNKTQSPPLSEVIKGSSASRTSAKSRVRATTPPPRSAQQQAPSRSASRASSPFDVSFGVGAWKTTGGIGSTANNVYQNSYGSQDNYSMHPRSPFEVPPFPDPDMYTDYQPEPPPPPFGYAPNKGYSDSTSFEPGKFTPPRKHNVEGMPPPSRRKNTSSRGFNVRDTEGPRPFVGVQTVMDQFMPPSPPLQVEPPPVDENNPPPKRPFEPTPFSRPQPHTVYNDRPPREPRGPRASQWKTAPPPPPRPPKNKWNQATQPRRGGPSPFDRVKDIFTSKPNEYESKNEGKLEDKVKFKVTDKVEVMKDEWSPFDSEELNVNTTPKTSNVRFVDAEFDGDDGTRYQGFADAWKGGPESVLSQDQEDHPSSTNPFYVQEDDKINPNQPLDAMKRAYELLANPQVQAVASNARSNTKVREAVQACMGDPTQFGVYLEDPNIGPILQELKDCINGL